MKALSRQEAIRWCQVNHIPLNPRALPEHPDFDFTFRIPGDAQKRVVLAKRAMKAFAEESAVLVWFDDWAVWQAGQRMHIFDRFRMSYGETQRIIDAPAQFFLQTEIEDAISFVIVAVLFLWDCYVLCPNRNKFLFFSHDEHGGAKGINLEQTSPG
jgi:hypothetical protein